MHFRNRRSPEQERIARLEKKMQTKDKDEVLAELMAEHVALKKKPWGDLNGVWVAPDVRDEVGQQPLAAIKANV